eukprot:m51a1_g3205 putative centromere protein x (77) ;mRNA; r:19525-20101
MSASFDPKLCERILQLAWGDQNARVKPEVAKLMAEYMRLLVVEAINRAHAAAESEGTALSPEHFEKCLPQLLLDFC